MQDILMYISDQHAWLQQGYAGDPIVKTPNLDRIAAQGTVMQNCCTSYPLCVPARMSMMSGQTASHCRVMSNMTALDSNKATFAHCLDAGGYETVLCGRMHFVGPDQRHGFEKRIAGEQTPIFHNRPNEAFKKERGVHDHTPQGTLECLRYIGAGNSPTLEYDRYVVSEALKYLKNDHEIPQFLCVGTYGPHHPYVAPKELYEYYLERVSVPEESFLYEEHPALKGYLTQDTDPEVVRAVRAAYYGMVEFEDMQIGKVYDAFQEYLQRTGHKGIFVYVSDHGEHAGYRGYYGKSTFYEPSIHVPMIFSGDGILRGREIQGAVSLMDLGPTLCELAGVSQIPEADGISLCPQLQEGKEDLERMVISEVGGECRRGGLKQGEFYYGQMVKYHDFKLLHFHGYDEEDILYRLDIDPQEAVNVIGQYPEIAEKMNDYRKKHTPNMEQIRRSAESQKQNLKILMKCNLDDEEERWHAPECARQCPELLVQSKLLS